MRSDQQQPQNVRTSSQWRSGQLENDFVVDQKSGEKRMNSFSGHERNCLFINRDGKAFHDLSLLSGLDNLADGRTFVYWDYDHDGWQDIALVNANTPLLNLYRNSLGQVGPNGRTAGNFIALRYVGGNRSAMPDPELSCRDGYGAKIEVDLGHTRLKREYRCGEGFCAQNSDTMIVGIGQSTLALSVTVRWPSGKTFVSQNVPRGRLLTAFENLEESADGSGFDVTDYVSPQHKSPVPTVASVTTQGVRKRVKLPGAAAQSNDGRAPAGLRVYTTMATWCKSCQDHLPQLVSLRSAFSPEQLQVYGVPIDPQDTPSQLKQYMTTFQPAYRLLLDLTNQQRSHFQGLLLEELGFEALPSTIVTDEEGHLLQSMSSIPTVSQLRKWMRVRTTNAR